MASEAEELFTAVKLEIYIPEQYVNSLRDALHAAGAGRVGNYDHCLSMLDVRGYWRPLEGATPYEGRIGEIAEGMECKVEVRCDRWRVADALAAIRGVHPYDEPVVNVIPLVNHLFVAPEGGV